MTAVRTTARSTTATPPHSFENTRTVCHHAPRATHVDRRAARAHNGDLQISAGFVAKYLPKGLIRSVPRAGITFALCLHERSAAIGHQPTQPGTLAHGITCGVITK